MNQVWINKKQSHICVIFFNGWGMDENSISGISSDGIDLLMINDYKTIKPLDHQFFEYKTIIIIAWSLGVWAAQQILIKSNIKITRCIAINGTPIPMDNLYGIPEEIFYNTMDGWNDLNKDRFNRRMMGGNINLKMYTHLLSKKSTIEQKEELQCIYNNFSLTNIIYSWDISIIGSEDLIIPYSNQINWWTGKTKIIEFNIPHFPFLSFKNWNQLINL